MTIWKDEADRLLESKKKYVREYLNTNGVAITSAGYNVLLFVILKASEKPNFSCAELFDAYVEEVLKTPTKTASKGAYKNAYYAVTHSKYSSSKVFQFIKECSISLE